VIFEAAGALSFILCDRSCPGDYGLELKRDARRKLPYLIGGSEANQNFFFQHILIAGRPHRELTLTAAHLLFACAFFSGGPCMCLVGDGRTASARGALCCTGEVLSHLVKKIQKLVNFWSP
jgi:hypothetical protein